MTYIWILMAWTCSVSGGCETFDPQTFVVEQECKDQLALVMRDDIAARGYCTKVEAREE